MPSASGHTHHRTWDPGTSSGRWRPSSACRVRRPVKILRKPGCYPHPCPAASCSPTSRLCSKGPNRETSGVGLWSIGQTMLAGMTLTWNGCPAKPWVSGVISFTGDTTEAAPSQTSADGGVGESASRPSDASNTFVFTGPATASYRPRADIFTWRRTTWASANSTLVAVSLSGTHAILLLSGQRGGPPGVTKIIFRSPPTRKNMYITVNHIKW